MMPELDSIRGIAILGVLLYHGLYWGIDLARFSPLKRLVLTATWTGRLGVELFFVLSGFLITGILLDSRTREGYYRRFYVRRALRILPVYFLTLFILYLFKVAPPNFLILSAAYLANLTPLFGVVIAYPVLWSLAVEEHFYLLWPAVVRKLNERRLAICCVLVVALSPALRAFSYYLAARHGYVSYKVDDYTWNSADGLACGALLAVWLRVWRPTRAQFARMLGWLVLAGVVLGVAGLPFGILTRRTMTGAALQIVPWHFVFIAVVGGFLLLGSSAHKRWVQPKFLIFLGGISYGLYLNQLMCFWAFEWLQARHWTGPLKLDPFWGLLLRVVEVGGVAIFLAWLSRRYFEDPFLRLKKRFS
jgi:peptidoglycan/LPS O-acetylase OafA/YrhL